MRPSTRSPRNSSLSLDWGPMLEWVRAKARRPVSEKRYPSRCWSSSSCAASVDDFTNPVVPDRERPFPEFPEVRVAICRKENDFRFANKILERNIADIGPAVGGIVPIVSHHEIMVLGNDKHRRVVQIRLRIALQDVVAHAIWQCFAILGDVMF